ncbi:hypothetical protein [Candidatus Nanohalococcus occultus]|uniref:Phosphomannomutase n=1 Tax=Candidatus Nanohalococcus occultus TaxID=2978047 RepID=A0ABY8CEC8_9ARCH|nr:Phosphomannomutase [Candidatus Nanohaloarchaeota archaeon SVXNc]
MRIGIDFDRVIFDTENFDEYFKNNTGLYHVEESVYDSNGNYSPEKHAEKCGINVETVYNALSDLSNFLYEDIRNLSELEGHQLVLVTRGRERFQEKKVEASGAKKLVDSVEYIESGSKDEAGIDVLIDDREAEIERAEVPGFVFDRQNHDAEDIIDFIRAEEVFNRYDVRGYYPEQINESFAADFGKAIGSFLLENDSTKLVVSRDNKESSEELKPAFIEAVRSTGIDVVDVGVGPADYAAFSGVKEQSHAVEVTSSHLPLDTNGFKMMYPEGNGFINEDLNRIKQIFRKKNFEEGNGELIETSYREEYVTEALELFEQIKDRSEGKIVYESMGGAGSVFVPDLLRQAGFEVNELSEEHSRPHIDPPNPKPELLRHVETEVEVTDADMGLANDMDADRVALYYDGEWIDGNTLFALFTQLIRPERMVASIDTSQVVEDSFDGQIRYTRVGDPFVIDETINFEAALSGEPNGHYCFTQFVPYNSGTLAALLLAGTDLEKRLADIPEFYNLRKAIQVEEKNSKMEGIVQEASELFEVISEADGVCYRTEDARVLIRPSGSSPKIRAIADANSQQAAQKALDEAIEMIENA